MPVVGTAGHVDHGKSTLIEAISGRDPDRWAEEKRRGLTIDLGFAWATLPGGVEVSFVDVPGHEKFSKNMLAGIEPIDVALLVVAADEGWKPQSEEHLAVLDLLEVTRGVVALTKVDLVDPELVDLASTEVAERLLGTSLESAPAVPVSGLTGEGIPRLLEILAGSLPDAHDDSGRPRLWVDRSFAVPGAGTIVTGTLIGGSLAVDDTVEIYPRSATARVRGIQSHERSLDRVTPGRRVALNLGGVDHHGIGRGDMIGLPDQWDLTSRFSGLVRSTRQGTGFDKRGAYHMHVGAASHGIEIVAIEEDRAVIQVSSPVPLAAGDRFILRDTGRRAVIGGGRVLDPAPDRVRRALVAARHLDLDAGPDAVADGLLAIRGHDTLDRLTAHSGGGRPAVAVTIGSLAVHPDRLSDLTDEVIALVAEFHDEHPLRPGMPLATISARLGVDPEVIDLIAERSTALERKGPDIAAASRVPDLDAGQEGAWSAAVELLRASLAVPDETELGLDPEVIHLKVRNGELVRIAPGLVYLHEQIDQLKGLLASAGAEFTVAAFRDVTGLSRKYAIPILEWADKEGLTVRRGDIRSLR